MTRLRGRTPGHGPDRKRLLTIVGPGILVAATGVGAGDLATAAFTGSHLGTAILWAVLLGAFFKLVLSEGLTRWQLATGETLLEGAVHHLWRPAQYRFLVYFLAWSFMVAAALMSACGVAAQAMLPAVGDPEAGKILFGAIHSLVGVALVKWGGYRLFEKVMGACIGLMFITVLATAVLIRPEMMDLLSGLLVPRIPDLDGAGLGWTIALMGGVGGTVTVLCYGYWIREEGRFAAEDLALCRVDLAVGYAMTALFGLAMVVIGSTIEVEGRGATLVIRLADQLGARLGAPGRWAFLLGAWGAIFSSLLGVWQSVPYLFADLWDLLRRDRTARGQKIDVRSLPYRAYLWGLASIPMIGLWVGFARMQKLYAIIGAAFMPILALTLLLLNGRARWIGERYRNSGPMSAVLAAILLFFLVAGWLSLRRVFFA
jgi:Mn2+/Fe2+ NRAMP family transporter